MSDRIGELCQFCGKGRLYPTGKTHLVKPDTAQINGEVYREIMEYECDLCKHRTGSMQMHLGETITESAEVKVEDKKKKENG